MKPITKTACRKCGTILLVDSNTGAVDAHKSPFRDIGESDGSGIETSGNNAAPPVLEMGSTDKGSRDWTAIIILTIVLVLIIFAGIYFASRLDVFQQTFQSFSKLLESFLRIGRAGIQK